MNKEKQKKLITEIMDADARDGIYHIGDTNKMVTAVEWLENKIRNEIGTLNKGFMFSLIEHAKAMEEQQIIDIYHDAYKNGRKDNGIHGIEYYNQMFKKQTMSQESIDNQSDDIEELAKDVLYTKYPHHPWKDTGYWIDMFKEGYNKAKEKYKYIDDAKAKTMVQQTAVEWYTQQLRTLALDPNHHIGLGDIRLTQGHIDELLEQARAMEKLDEWDEIEQEYMKDEYPVFGGPFTNALKPFEWLKKNYYSPKRKQI